MALTPQDIQLIKEAIKPDLDALKNSLEQTMFIGFRKIVEDVYGDFTQHGPRIGNLENKLYKVAQTLS